MKKFFYLLIVFLIGIFIAYISYNGNKYEHISGLVNEAIEKEEYAEIAKIFGGCCDTAPLAKDDSPWPASIMITLPASVSAGTASIKCES